MIEPEEMLQRYCEDNDVDPMELDSHDWSTAVFLLENHIEDLLDKKEVRQDLCENVVNLEKYKEDG